MKRCLPILLGVLAVCSLILFPAQGADFVGVVGMECQYRKGSDLAPKLERIFVKLRDEGSLSTFTAAYGAQRELLGSRCTRR